ncbi:glycoside hydrolase family 32 protein [Christiangramia salexigens]|uniref:Glycosyl hydrolase family 32 n=1 Tax=Christiangramia salexigens TaxID=1913577 RepID=A0A1L3J506_9FLAO|nr:glycoside hydrolase family 32 protein [Christiangramia salexigens]APG60239.1 glycosyl hydrolase family 32 [Christiangramia salexigens]
MKIKIINSLLLMGIISLTLSCKDQKESTDTSKMETTNDSIAEAEKFRPSFHFTPEENWMNDPNGMFYLDGTYHLYFQYYPEDNVWGPMHWGHATSQDMITWKEEKIALKPDEKGYIFSGSAVVDKENTSGFGEEGKTPVVAMYTYHDPKGEKEGRKDYQTQAIAYSTDKGFNWTKFKDNPVIKNEGIKDFRDPKVTRDTINDQWLMVLATVDRTFFYSSQDLKEWKKISEFGQSTGAHNGVWECPDFFPMKVEETGETKWVLIQSLNPGGYNGGSGTQYFVGDFDGTTFTPEKNMQNLEEKHSFWLDFGRDNYAGVTWSNIPTEDGRTLFIGWMSNWLYAQEVPTQKWRSTMTLARELKLQKLDGVYRILSEPVKELDAYRTEVHKMSKNEPAKTYTYSAKTGDLMNKEISFSLNLKDLEKVDFHLSNSVQDTLKFGLNKTDKQFYVNRKKSGLTDFSEKFIQKVSTAPRISNSDTLKVHFILDKTSIEIFYDNGTTVVSEIFFPNEPYTSFGIRSKSDLHIKDLKVNEITK